MIQAADKPGLAKCVLWDINRVIQCYGLDLGVPQGSPLLRAQFLEGEALRHICC